MLCLLAAAAHCGKHDRLEDATSHNNGGGGIIQVTVRHRLVSTHMEAGGVMAVYSPPASPVPASAANATAPTTALPHPGAPAANGAVALMGPTTPPGFHPSLQQNMIV